MDADYTEETAEANLSGKRRKRLSKFTKAVQKKKPKFNPGKSSQIIIVTNSPYSVMPCRPYGLLIVRTLLSFFYQ